MRDEDREFQKVVMEGLVPKMADSAVCVSLVPREGEDPADHIDAKFCVELGVMIMLDKPIMAVVQPGAKVPEKLRLVADMIVEADLATSEGQQALSAGVDEFLGRHE